LSRPHATSSGSFRLSQLRSLASRRTGLSLIFYYSQEAINQSGVGEQKPKRTRGRAALMYTRPGRALRFASSTRKCLPPLLSPSAYRSCKRRKVARELVSRRRKHNCFSSQRRSASLSHLSVASRLLLVFFLTHPPTASLVSSTTSFSSLRQPLGPRYIASSTLASHPPPLFACAIFFLYTTRHPSVSLCLPSPLSLACSAVQFFPLHHGNHFIIALLTLGGWPYILVLLASQVKPTK